MLFSVHELFLFPAWSGLTLLSFVYHSVCSRQTDTCAFLRPGSCFNPSVTLHDADIPVLVNFLYWLQLLYRWPILIMAPVSVITHDCTLRFHCIKIKAVILSNQLPIGTRGLNSHTDVAVYSNPTKRKEGRKDRFLILWPPLPLVFLFCPNSFTVLPFTVHSFKAFCSRPLRTPVHITTLWPPLWRAVGFGAENSSGSSHWGWGGDVMPKEQVPTAGVPSSALFEAKVVL